MCAQPNVGNEKTKKNGKNILCVYSVWESSASVRKMVEAVCSAFVVGRRVVKHLPNNLKINMLATLAKLRPRQFVSMLKSSIVRPPSIVAHLALAVKIASNGRLKFAMRNIFINDFSHLMALTMSNHLTMNDGAVFRTYDTRTRRNFT